MSASPTDGGTAEAARKVKVLTDVRIIIEPSITRWRRLTMQEWAALYEEWVKEFKSFLRDHRSQDVNSLEVERIYEEQCSLCGRGWEVSPEEECDGVMLPPSCAHCGALVAP